MSDPDVQHPSDTVLHQDAIEAIVDERIDDAALPEHAAIADVGAPGASYVQAEAAAARTAINAILAALRTANIVAT